MKITLTDKNGNQVLAVESSNPVKRNWSSKFPFVAKKNYNFDVVKMVQSISEFCKNLDDNRPKFNDENFQITDVEYIIYKPEYKKDVLSDPDSWFTGCGRGGVIEFELDYIDKSKPIPNHNKCCYTLYKTVIGDLARYLKSKGLPVPKMILNNGDYPIDLRSDYRGHEITLYFEFDSNAKEILGIVDNFNHYIGDKFKSFVNTNIEQELFITDFDFREVDRDNIAAGWEQGCGCIFDCRFSENIRKSLEKGNFKPAWKLLRLFEDKFNATLQNHPLSKEYVIKFEVENLDGWEFSDFDGYILFAKK